MRRFTGKIYSDGDLGFEFAVMDGTSPWMSWTTTAPFSEDIRFTGTRFVTPGGGNFGADVRVELDPFCGAGDVHIHFSDRFGSAFGSIWASDCEDVAAQVVRDLEDKLLYNGFAWRFKPLWERG